MRLLIPLMLCVGLLAGAGSLLSAQEGESTAAPEPVASATDDAAAEKAGNELRERAEEVVGGAGEKIGEIAERVDQSEQAKELSAGVLEPIYTLADALSFPAFYWITFFLMFTGVVSFSLQLVLGKLAVLSKMSISIKEIISDAVGLLISLLGLVLTTQAATQNSTFPSSPAAVLSAAGAGLVLGLILYSWGQQQELQAATARGLPEKKSAS